MFEIDRSTMDNSWRIICFYELGIDSSLFRGSKSYNIPLTTDMKQCVFKYIIGIVGSNERLYQCISIVVYYL